MDTSADGDIPVTAGAGGAPAAVLGAAGTAAAVGSSGAGPAEEEPLVFSLDPASTEYLLKTEEDIFMQKRRMVAELEHKRQEDLRKQLTEGVFSETVASMHATAPSNSIVDTSKLTKEETGDALLMKLKLLRDGQVWDAKKNAALTVELPDFAYDKREEDKNNTLVLRLKYQHMADSLKMYGGLNITTDPSPAAVDIIMCHFVFRTDLKMVGMQEKLKQRVSQGFKLGGKWTTQHGKDSDFPPQEFWLRIVFVPGAFLTYINGKKFAVTALPTELTPADGTKLFLHFLPTGERGEPSVLECEGAWFGFFQPSLEDLEEVKSKAAARVVVFKPGALYVEGVPPAAGRPEIMDLFKQFGVESVELHRERGAATVVLHEKEDVGVVNMVLRYFETKNMLMGNRIQVSKARIS